MFGAIRDRTNAESATLQISAAPRRARHRTVRNREQAMDVEHILAELREEREQVEAAIPSLERLVRGRGRRCSRPPAWLAQVTTKRRGRRPGTRNKLPPKET